MDKIIQIFLINLTEIMKDTVSFQDVSMETESQDDLNLVLSDDSREPSECIKPEAPPKISTIKVRSSDGKPKNIQITTLSSIPSKSSDSELGSCKMPTIQVKSSDGKPKKVQITTLATFTSPRAKGGNSKPEQITPNKNKTNPEVLKEKTGNKDSADSVAITDSEAEKSKDCATPKSENAAEKRTSEGKGTPKRVQLTTIQLFNNNSQSPRNVSNQDGSS